MGPPFRCSWPPMGRKGEGNKFVVIAVGENYVEKWTLWTI